MINRQVLLSAAAALGLLAGGGDRASADVTVFNNLGPPGTYGTFGWNVGNGDNQVPSMEFTVPTGQDYTLSEIDVIAQWIGFGSNSFVVSLEADNGGMPGTTLESWNTSLPETPSLLALTSNTPVTLVGGASYWVSMAVGSDPNARGQWYSSSTGATGPVFLSFFFSGTDDASLYSTQSGFQVLGQSPMGSSAPEPSTALLAGLGAWILIARSVRRRRARAAA